MNKTFLKLSTFALIAGSTLIGASSAYAYRGDATVQGPNCTPERHTAMLQAFENKDYNAWKSLMAGKGRVAQVITKDNFAKFAQMHKLRLEGKTEEANAMRTELGLGMRDGSGKDQGQGYGKISK